MKNKNRILVVDDEESLCEILQFNLEVEGYQVDVVYSGEAALELELENYSLILLDVMMGGISGFKTAQKIKTNPKWLDIPIIFCTAKDTEDDTIIGLKIGADDYIKKPFSTREVVARVSTVLRRTGNESINKEENEIISFEDLSIDRFKHLCVINGEKINLTKKELEILILLLQKKGRILAREEILHNVWSDDVVVLDRTIDVNITRLRKKIGIYGKNIITRLGYGYGFEI
ncbi:MAG: response regulator transcription factor [Bacteroidales bacterium]